MMKTSLFAAILIATTAGAAHAGGQAGSLGVGAEYSLTGLGGVSMNADQGDFHVGGFLGFVDPEGKNNTVFTIGGRFFFHVHSTTTSDFSVGGNIAFANYPDPMNAPNQNDRLTAMFLEPAFQIRAFISSNVALSATGGVIIGVVDASGVAITGQTLAGSALADGIGLTGAAGIHYYFF